MRVIAKVFRVKTLFFFFVLLLFPFFDSIGSKGKISKQKEDSFPKVKPNQKVESHQTVKSNQKVESKQKVKLNQKVGIKRLKSILDRYKKSKFLFVKFKKKVFLSFLESKKESQGKLYFSRGKLRLEIDKPEAFIMVFDGTSLWWEQKLPKELGGEVRVTHTSRYSLDKKFNIFLALFTNSVKTEDQYKVLDYSKEGKNESFQLKLNDTSLNIGLITIEFSRKKNLITQISFKDELTNVITYTLRKTTFERKISKRKFRYTPPKEAKIIEL